MTKSEIIAKVTASLNDWNPESVEGFIFAFAFDLDDVGGKFAVDMASAPDCQYPVIWGIDHAIDKALSQKLLEAEQLAGQRPN